MADANIGAAGAVFVAVEDTYGTAIDPSAIVTPSPSTLTRDAGDGIWMPVLSETVAYTEPDRYFSEQIRNETVVSDVKASYYHVEGDLVVECDAQYLPYLLIASRHDITQIDAGGRHIYTATPSKRGATYPGSTTAKGMSVGVIRNDETFLYSGNVVNQFAFTLENGIGRLTASLLGLKETEMATPANVQSGGSNEPNFGVPNLFGADAHAIFVDASGTGPAFASPDATFNGYTATINHNGEAQNRVKRDRSASYVKYGLTDITADSELDFTSRAEFDIYKDASSFKAYRFESVNGADNWAAATSGYRITFYRATYATYEIPLSGAADLVMATTTLRGTAIAAGVSYKIEVISPFDLGLPPITT